MAGLAVKFEVLNQLNTPTLYADTLVNRPAPSIVGRIFFRTDSPYGIYRDTGISWDLVASPDTTGITGSIATGQVGFGSGTDTISGSNNLFWDSANNRLGIGTATPGTKLDIHGTGTMVQFNGTTTNDAFAVFQNAGSTKWRIGNNYSTGTNYFSIYDNANAIETIKITPGVTNTIDFNGILDINGTGDIFNVNGITTNDALINLQNAASTKWKIGNYYSTGTNYFSIYDNVRSSDIIKITSGTTGTDSTTTVQSQISQSVTQTGIDANATVLNSSFINNVTFNAGITRTGTNENGLFVRSALTFSGTYTKSSTGNMSTLLTQALNTYNGNFTQTQPAPYTLAPSVNSAGFQPNGTGTISHFATFVARPDLGGTSLTVTNRFQLLINNLAGFGGNNPAYTNRWAIYQDGSSDNNYFAGKVNIGTTTVGTNILSVNGTSLFSNTINIADAVNIAVQTTTGTKIGTANTQKIGFWNATPIVQPTTATTSATFVANAGTAINTLSTFDGYKIDQVVKALRNAGILA